METNIYLEIFGYIGTALVVLSMMMSSVTKLRIINMSGSVISAIYAGICNTWPIVVLNVSLFLINGFHLLRDAKMRKKQNKNSEKSEGISVGTAE